MSLGNGEEYKTAEEGLTDEKLYNYWLQTHQQPTPEGLLPFSARKQGEPPSYYMKPEDIQRYRNAQDVWELLSGRVSPIREKGMDYSTSALNFPKVNLYASETGNPFSTLGKSVSEEASEHSMSYLKQFIPQAMQAHEYGHAIDPRINMYGQIDPYNKGYTTFLGHPASIGLRELEAVKAEDEYWKKMFGLTRSKPLPKP